MDGEGDIYHGHRQESHNYIEQSPEWLLWWFSIYMYSSRQWIIPGIDWWKHLKTRRNIVILFRARQPPTRRVQLHLYHLGAKSPSLCDEAASIDFGLSRSEWYRERSSMPRRCQNHGSLATFGFDYVVHGLCAALLDKSEKPRRSRCCITFS